MTREANHFRRAFSLIEILVVICIIAVLVAFLMPAIQQARIASLRAQNNNNLYQLGRAFHVYENTYHLFPNEDQSSADSQLFVMILPYIEQSSYNYQASPPTSSVKLYLDPLRRTSAPGKTDYAVARQDNWTLLTTGSANRSILGGKSTGDSKFKGVSNADVTGADGTSNTILLSEKGLATNYYNNPIGDGTGSYLGGSDPGFAVANTATPANESQVSYDHQRLLAQPSGVVALKDTPSFMAGGTSAPCNFFGTPFPTIPCLFADGSVRNFQFKDADAVNWSNLWSYNDGQSANVP